MMAHVNVVFCLALIAGAASLQDTVKPVAKVIELLEGLKKEVEDDGTTEAKNYDEFACFCKKTTEEKVKSVNKGKDSIDDLSADIADKTQSKKEDSTELLKRQKEQEKLKKDLADEEARCAKEKAEYEAEEADLSKAIQGLKDAIKAMEDSKPASLLAIRETLVNALQMAETMNLVKRPKHKAVSSLLQQSNGVAPSDPEYKFHSNDIIDVCKDLLKDYKANKEDLDTEWGKTKKGCEAMQSSLKKKIKANKEAMDKLDKSISKLAKEIAEHRSDLVEAEAQMKDDELYLKDLQVRCEARAHDYDQRSAQRGAELEALTTALEVLTKDVKKADDEANERALLLQRVARKPVVAVQPAVAHEKKAEAAPATLKTISFLQSSAGHALRGRSSEAKKETALAMLEKEGNRIGSLTLTSLAARASADPFKKVKGLIQKLIERLLTEAKNEATKKGFCDTEMGKAESDRDFRFTEANDLSADLEQLEAKEDALTLEIADLKKSIKAETKALKEETEDRKKEKEANKKTLKTAKEGYEAVNSALLTLKTFYKQAAKASFIQASPVDEDTSGPGFSGNYKGKQGGMKAVFALLETISSDFDRTIRTTEEAEATAHREFVEFKQTADASIAGKTTKKELDEDDLKTTKTSIKTKMSDLQTAMDLLDKALETLEELKPTCMDTGMSYKERVAKREEEMKALKKALCQLDEENVEPDCK